MGIVNWRREAMYIALAGMETCWVVGLSRVLLKHPRSTQPLVSWWSVFALYLLALAAFRILGRLESRRDLWFVAGFTLLTSMLLLEISLGGVSRFLQHPSDPSAGLAVVILLLGFSVWYRALRMVHSAGETRATIRQFQIGLLILVSAMLVSLRSPTTLTDLVIAYFALGLLAVALTRGEEVAQMEPDGAAPLDRKWVFTLTATLLILGAITFLARLVITVDTVRWVLQPFVTVIQFGLFVLVVITTSLLMLILPLLRRLFDEMAAEDFEQTMQQWRESSRLPLPTEQTEGAQLSSGLAEALQITILVLVIVLALWLVARSFRRWQSRHHTTPGAVRETVPSEATLAEDLAGYFQDQWQRLRGVDLRLFRRMRAGSAREIYASLLTLMAAADHPRQLEQTPHEYQPVVENVLPGRRKELRALTEAYVRVRYGESEVEAEELSDLQAAWHRIQADAKELL